jgi:hypothetical protein
MCACWCVSINPCVAARYASNCCCRSSTPPSSSSTSPSSSTEDEDDEEEERECSRRCRCFLDDASARNSFSCCTYCCTPRASSIAEASAASRSRPLWWLWLWLWLWLLPAAVGGPRSRCC